MGGDGQVVAAVDIGTNSVRLLVARATDGTLHSLDRRMRITRLGQGVDATAGLAAQAVARTVDAVAGFAAVWRGFGAARVRITATSAARDAGNVERLLAGIGQVTGTTPEVLTGEEEAALAFRGATTSRPAEEGPFVVLDIGGGSTELIRGQDFVLAATSRQLGSVRLTERVLDDDPPTPAQLAEARRLVDLELDAAEQLVQPSAARTLIGTAGTVTTIAALDLGLPADAIEELHDHRLSAGSVTRWADHLCAMTVAERRALDGIAPGREDVIAAGALILDRVVGRFGFPEVVVSRADILDGIALSLLD